MYTPFYPAHGSLFRQESIRIHTGQFFGFKGAGIPPIPCFCRLDLRSHRQLYHGICPVSRSAGIRDTSDDLSQTTGNSRQGSPVATGYYHHTKNERPFYKESMPKKKNCSYRRLFHLQIHKEIIFPERADISLSGFQLQWVISICYASMDTAVPRSIPPAMMRGPVCRRKY